MDDAAYVRRGTANVFCAVEPRTGRRLLEVTERRANVDFAFFVRRLVDEVYPQAERLVVVLDNLSTHGTAALDEAFPPAEARRVAAKLELHFTPTHGSWLNMAESELSVLTRQCLNRRLPRRPTCQGKPPDRRGSPRALPHRPGARRPRRRPRPSVVATR